MDTFLVHIEQHKDEFFRYVRRSVWDTGVAEDVFSQGVLTAYENRHKFKEGTNFRAWMYRILTNKCYVANREISRRGEPLETADQARFADLGDDDAHGQVLRDPEAFLEQCGDEVFRAFRRLSAAERSCLLLRVMERFSYAEIAESLEMPAGTVMTHLSRGRAKLRKELAEYGRDSGILRKLPRLFERRDDAAAPEVQGNG